MADLVDQLLGSIEISMVQRQVVLVDGHHCPKLRQAKHPTWNACRPRRACLAGHAVKPSDHSTSSTPGVVAATPTAYLSHGFMP